VKGALVDWWHKSISQYSSRARADYHARHWRVWAQHLASARAAYEANTLLPGSGQRISLLEDIVTSAIRLLDR
jgi:hypothetical protein